MKNEFIIECQTGKSFKAKKSDYITIVDLEAKQVVDFFAVNLNNNNEFDVQEHDLLHLCCRSEIYEFFYKKVKVSIQ